MKKTAPRNGYALVLVIAFMTLLLSLLGLLYRQLGAALRVDSVRSAQVIRDEGSLHALARAVALLQTGKPPSDPYVCGVAIDFSTGPREYLVTYSTTDDTTWLITSTPAPSNENPDPMPDTFAVP